MLRLSGDAFCQDLFCEQRLNSKWKPSFVNKLLFCVSTVSPKKQLITKTFTTSQMPLRFRKRHRIQAVVQTLAHNKAKLLA